MKTGTDNQTTESVQQHEGLRSLHLEIENFKNIEKTVIDIGGRSLFVLGKNKTGKSTFIQAMTASMDSRLLPDEPIKEGEERARILHKIGGNVQGEYVEYTIEIFFTPKNNKGRVTVTNMKGELMKSPATLIKSIIGNVSFDVTKWLNEPKAKKLEIIKSLTGRGADIDKITFDIKTRKDSLKSKKDRIESLEGALSNHEFTQEEVEKYSTLMDISSIQSELSTISVLQQQHDDITNKMTNFQTAVDNAAKNINNASAEIDRLNRAVVDQKRIIEQEVSNADIANGNIAKGRAWLQSNHRPSIDEVNARLQIATIHNEKHGRIGNLSFQHKEKVTAMQEADKMKADIEKLENQRAKIISESQLPIQGLSFTDEEILIDNLPLDDKQINTATRFDIGVEIAMALNPTLKIIYLHDASLYDKEHLKSIVKRIEERGYMAICEIVAENSDVEVKFAETYLN